MTTAIAADAARWPQAADARFEGIADPVEQALAVLRWAGDTFGDEFAITSSMADGLLAHLASRAIPGVHVVFLDTGYHFAETHRHPRLDHSASCRSRWSNVTARSRPSPSRTPSSARSCTSATPTCAARCARSSRWREALAGYVAWGSGVRRDESPTRAGTQVVDWDAKRGMVKVNPMAAWTQDDVDAYIAEHQVPVNPLFELGYGSIGCAPCTRPVAPGEDPRAGRWAGRGKTECGIHT